MCQKVAAPPADAADAADAAAAAAAAEPPPNTETPTLRKSRSLDAILTHCKSRYSPKKGYGIDLDYRVPRYDPRTHFVTICKGTGRSSPLSPACSPRSPRPVRVWGNSPLLPMPMSRTLSLPTILPSDDEGGPSSQLAAPPSGPRPCPAPQSGGVCKLERNTDAAWACIFCGAVGEMTTMMPQERASNCPKHKARDQVGEVQNGTAQQASSDAWADGPESLHDRSNRIRSWAGGTHMSQRQARRMDVQRSANTIDRVAWKGAREDIEGDARLELIRRKIIDVLEVFFKQINGLHHGVAKRIRLTAVDFYAASMQHEKVCQQPGCMFALSQRSNMAVAYGVVEHVLTRLRKNKTELEQTTGGNVTPEQIKKQLSHVKQLQLVPMGHSQLQQVTSAIAIISRWGSRDACKPCLQVSAVPPELRLPPSLIQSRESGTGGKQPMLDPGDVTVKLRNDIVAVAKLSSTRGDVRNAALKYLAVPQVVAFLTDSEHHKWPVQLMACLVLRASACKIERSDSTIALRETLLDDDCVCANTFLKSATGLELLMNEFEPPPAPEEDDIYACE